MPHVSMNGSHKAMYTQTVPACK